MFLAFLCVFQYIILITWSYHIKKNGICLSKDIRKQRRSVVLGAGMVALVPWNSLVAPSVTFAEKNKKIYMYVVHCCMLLVNLMKILMNIGQSWKMKLHLYTYSYIHIDSNNKTYNQQRYRSVMINLINHFTRSKILMFFL